jgi:amphi-Trp domain-containing protein
MTDSEHDVEGGHDSGPDEDEQGTDRTTIRTGREFEQEYRIGAAEAGEFLVDLGEQLRDGDELTITDEEWELPFAFGEPVELEVDFDGVGEPELEIELELPGRPDENAPSVE